jgi:DNA-binding NtrC family response regulator
MRRQPITSRPTSIESDRSVGRVLYVDDDAFAASLLRATLEDAGFEVQWTPCARSALDGAALGAYDAYLLGVVRGDASRRALAEKLAAIDGAGRCVIVAGCQETFPQSLNVRVLKKRDMPRALVATMEAESKRRRFAA